MSKSNSDSEEVKKAVGLDQAAPFDAVGGGQGQDKEVQEG
jgi:hypothetical protein